MTEISDSCSNVGSIDSISISEFSSKDLSGNIEIKEEETNNDFLIRCPNCSNISKFYADFEKNYFYTSCVLNHKNEYTLFDSFLENSYKNLKILLCQECQKSVEDCCSNMFKCNTCNLFFCSNCKEKHKNEISHSKFISIERMDNYCPIHNEEYKYFDNNKKKHLCQTCLNRGEKDAKNKKENIIEIAKFCKFKDNINENYYKSKEIIKMYNNINKGIKEWLKRISNKFNAFLNAIKNYCILQYKIVSSMNFDNSYEKYQNNFNAYFNYNIINNEKIDNLIKNINNYINKKFYQNGDDVCNVLKNLIELQEIIGKKDTNIESKKNLAIQREKKIFQLYSDKIANDRNKIKLEFMEKKKYEFKSTITSFISFDENKYFVLGFKNGKIKIYEEANNFNEKKEENENCLVKKLTIKEFDNEINNICGIDYDKFVSSDIKKMIKIIQIIDKYKSYSIINTINSMEEMGKIYNISFLPIFSYYRNRHHFCISDNDKLLIYKSNKMPLSLEPPGLNYHSKIEEYTIVQPTFIINGNNNNNVNGNNNPQLEHKKEPLNFTQEKVLDLKIEANCVKEIDEKYMAAAFSNGNCVKIFNMQNKFEQVISIPNISANEGNFSLSISKNREKLLVGSATGISVISIDNFKKITKFHLNQSILNLDFYNIDIVVAAVLKNEDYYIKQYDFKSNFKEISKFSEFKTYSPSKINNLKVINNRIYYLNDTNFLHYFQLN